jgi:TfoX/Sxy family transcriptional regulator of competence genes
LRIATLSPINLHVGSNKQTVAFIVEQLGAGITSKAMFGEYAVYRQGLLIGLICDEQLFLKPTDAARALLDEVVEAPPYPGAKPSFLIGGELWDDAELMAELARATANGLAKTPSKRGASKRGASKRSSGT